MNSGHASRILIKKWLEEFDSSDHSDSGILEKELSKLEALRTNFQQNSTDPNITARARARARDIEQNAAGLINGIKWSLAFINQKGDNDDFSEDVTR